MYLKEIRSRMEGDVDKFIAVARCACRVQILLLVKLFLVTAVLNPTWSLGRERAYYITVCCA